MRMMRDGVGHLLPETLVHRVAADCRALSVPAAKPGRRGPMPVIPTAEREADDKLRRLAAPPGLSWAAAAVACLVYWAHRGRRRWGRPDQAQTRGGDRLRGRRLHHDGTKTRLRRRTATDGIEEGCLGGSNNLPSVDDLVDVVVVGVVHPPRDHGVVSRCDTEEERLRRGRERGGGHRVAGVRREGARLAPALRRRQEHPDWRARARIRRGQPIRALRSG
jgi:hypothetical protein